MNRYQWIFFDADNTLFDFEQAEAQALQDTFRDLALEFRPQHAEAYHTINQQVWTDFEAGRITAAALRLKRFELLFEALSIRQDVPAFSDRYLFNLSLQGGLLPGAREVVETLSTDYHLAIITNGLSDVQRPRLANSGIQPYFSAVFISEELGVSKPNPAFFEAVFAGLAGHRCPPARATTLVVGDSLSSDIQGGRNAGLDTCWFNPAGRPANPQIMANYEIQNLKDIYNIL